MSDLPTLDLSGGTALVVGGAGGGIGSAVTLALADAGAEIHIVTFDREHAEDVIEAVSYTHLTLPTIYSV